MMLIGVMFSGSRGTWLSCVGAICALLVFGLRYGTVRWWVPITCVVVLLVSAGVAFSFSPDVRTRIGDAADTLRSGNLDTYVRIELARDALHIAHDHPFFGTGPGTFVFVHPRYQDSTFAYRAVLTHDDYLNCLTITG